MEKRLNWLIIILFISAFFRFYNFLGLQYFSDDEGLFFTTIRKMVVEKKLVLVSANQATNLSQGSFFHLFSLPFFLLTKGNPLGMGAIGSLLGVLTTYFVFKAGELKNKRIGLLASFIYASSFLIALFDRRFWQLSPGPILSIFALISLYKIINKAANSWFYAGVFVFSSLFAWHSDLSLLVVPFAGLLAWIKFRFKLFKKENIPALVLLLFSFLPLIIFDLRHNFVNSKGINLIFKKIGLNQASFINFDFRLFYETVIRMLFAMPEEVQNNFNYDISVYSAVKFPLLWALIIIFLFVPFLKLLLKEKGNWAELIMIFLLAFILGSFLYTGFYGGSFSQQYFTLVFPMICLIFAFGFDFWLEAKTKWAGYILLAIFFAVNLRTLFLASIKHPTIEKIEAVKTVKDLLMNKKFAAYYFDIEGGGMHYLYLLNDLHPVKCSTFDAWHWIYKSYGLFDVAPQSEWPDLVLVTKDNLDDNNSIAENKNVIYQTRYKDVKLLLLNNSKKWATLERLQNLK